MFEEREREKLRYRKRMGEVYYHMKRCERVAVMEVANRCAKTRTMEDTNEDSSKRRKIDSGELLNSSLSNDQMENQYTHVLNSRGNSLSPATSRISDHVPDSLRSSDESSKFVKDGLKSLDLKAELLETEISMLNNGGFRETTPSSILCRNSGEMESSTTQKKRSLSSAAGRKYSVSKMPSGADLEEFFSEAEKYEQKRFAEKYNYDIGKDIPLEGRYQWVRLKP